MKMRGKTDSDNSWYDIVYSGVYVLVKELSCQMNNYVWHVLVMVFITMRRYKDHGNSYKRKKFIGAGLWFQRFCPLLSRQETCLYAGRHGAIEDAESSLSGSESIRKRMSYWAWHEHLRH